MKLLTIAGINMMLGTMLLGIVPATNVLVLVGSIGVLCYSVHVLVNSFYRDLVAYQYIDDDGNVADGIEVTTRIDAFKLACVAMYAARFTGTGTDRKTRAPNKTTVTDITVR